MKKFVTFATAGALAFAGLGLGAVSANAAGSEWDDPNAGENYFAFDYTGKEIVGLTDAGKELAKREPVISLPRKNKDKDVTSVNAYLDGDGVTEIKSWGGIKEFHRVGDVKLPDNWGEITTISDNATIPRNLKTLPKSWGNITYIGEDAFDRLDSELVLPESWGQVKTIGFEAFAYAHISALPKSWGNVETIKGNAFYNDNLTAIPDDWGNVKTIGGYAFSNVEVWEAPEYQQLNRIAELPKSWGKVEVVGEKAFAYNRIHAIPNDFAGLKKLNEDVFANKAWNTTLDQKINSGGVYRLPAESLTADFKKAFFNWITFDENAKKSVLCTYDGANPNNIKSDFKILINDPERCKEVKPAEPAPKTETPSQPAPAQPEPGILTPAQPAPQQPAPKVEPTPAPVQPAPKAEPTPAPAPVAVPAPTQTEVKPSAEVKPGADANANASAANANGVATAKQNSAVLAETGSDLTVLGAAGVALLALAGAATLVARRRA